METLSQILACAIFLDFILIGWYRGLRYDVITKKYKTNIGVIRMPSEINREDLLKILVNQLNLPIVESIYLDQSGNLIIKCKVGQHKIQVDNNVLIHSDESFDYNKNKRMFYQEEKICIDYYIKKLFQIPMSYQKENKLEVYKRALLLNKLALILVVVLSIGFIATYFYGKKETETQYIEEVKESCPMYYPDICFGDAFEFFFEEPKWEYYEGSLDQEVVDVVEFSGICYYYEEETSTMIQFISEKGEEDFVIGSCTFDGVEQSEEVCNMLYDTVFTEYENN